MGAKNSFLMAAFAPAGEGHEAGNRTIIASFMFKDGTEGRTRQTCRPPLRGAGCEREAASTITRGACVLDGQNWGIDRRCTLAGTIVPCAFALPLLADGRFALPLLADVRCALLVRPPWILIVVAAAPLMVVSTAPTIAVAAAPLMVVVVAAPPMVVAAAPPARAP